MSDVAQPDESLEVFDCAEQGGFIWLFFGDKEMPASIRPSIPWVPELDLPGAC
jgi:phenylpropionate dioxygenase-like ring-hydroxylating dioxygenase large terminal subunit